MLTSSSPRSLAAASVVTLSLLHFVSTNSLIEVLPDWHFIFIEVYCFESNSDSMAFGTPIQLKPLKVDPSLSSHLNLLASVIAKSLDH